MAGIICDCGGGGRDIPDLITWIVANLAPRLASELVLRQEAWLGDHPPIRNQLQGDLAGIWPHLWERGWGGVEFTACSVGSRRSSFTSVFTWVVRKQCRAARVQTEGAVVGL